MSKHPEVHSSPASSTPKEDPMSGSPAPSRTPEPAELQPPRHGEAPNRRPWRYKRGQWSGRLPSLGGDEWCRRTLVIPTWLFGTVVFPLWTCRGCEFCDVECRRD